MKDQNICAPKMLSLPLTMNRGCQNSASLLYIFCEYSHLHAYNIWHDDYCHTPKFKSSKATSEIPVDELGLPKHWYMRSEINMPSCQLRHNVLVLHMPMCISQQQLANLNLAGCAWTTAYQVWKLRCTQMQRRNRAALSKHGCCPGCRKIIHTWLWDCHHMPPG